MTEYAVCFAGLHMSQLNLQEVRSVFRRVAACGRAGAAVPSAAGAIPADFTHRLTWRRRTMAQGALKWTCEPVRAALPALPRNPFAMRFRWTSF
jgi:hypothetical protein